jgi:hypothetical protein
MNTISDSVQKFFFEPLDSRPLAGFRIATALFGLVQAALLANSWGDIYGVNGYVEWFISYDLFSIKSLPSVINLADALLWLGIADNTALVLVSAVYVLSLLGLLLGYYARWSAITAWLTHFMLCNTAMFMGYGVETFLHIALFYLILSPSAEYYSLDALAGREGQQKANWQARFMIRIMQLHLCIVYFNAGIAKIQGSDWIEGEAIWYILGNKNYSQFSMYFLAEYPWLSKTLSWWTLIVETAYPIFIFWRPSRLFWWLNIIGLHIGIALFMGLYMFAAIMILHNIIAFGWTMPRLPLRQALRSLWRPSLKATDYQVFETPT